MSAEYDLQHSPLSPINQEDNTDINHRYLLNIDNGIEIIWQNDKGLLFDDERDVKALFDAQLKSDEKPDNMKIERYNDYNDEMLDREVILEFDKNKYLDKCFKYFELLDSPFSLTNDQLLELNTLKIELTL